MGRISGSDTIKSDYVRERLDRLAAQLQQVDTGPSRGTDRVETREDPDQEWAARATQVRPAPSRHGYESSARQVPQSPWTPQRHDEPVGEPHPGDQDDRSDRRRRGAPGARPQAPTARGSAGDSVHHGARALAGVPAAPVEDTVLPGLPFTRRHLTVLAVVLLLGAVITGYALTRARSVEVAAPARVEQQNPGAGPASPVGAPVPATPAPAPSATPAAGLRVHVLGAVRRPGVQKLPAGARVIDAVEAAGGLAPEARTGELNLAQVLTDGQQVIIGTTARPGGQVRGAPEQAPAPPGPSGAAQSGSAAPGGKINLNTATVAQLDTLPGVGQVTAEKILAWRTQHGRFSRVEELQEVQGIGPKSYADIAARVTV